MHIHVTVTVGFVAPTLGVHAIHYFVKHSSSHKESISQLIEIKSTYLNVGVIELLLWQRELFANTIEIFPSRMLIVPGSVLILCFVIAAKTIHDKEY